MRTPRFRLPLRRPRNLSTRRVRARVVAANAQVAASFGNRFDVYVYAADMLPGVPAPAATRLWISILNMRDRYGDEFLWCRSTGIGHTGAWARNLNGQINGWAHLQGELAFSLYGAPPLSTLSACHVGNHPDECGPSKKEISKLWRLKDLLKIRVQK